MASREIISVREQAVGLFGDLSVSDFEGARSLWCGSSCQGSSYLEPAAESGAQRLTPGPVPEAAYLLGWLVPGLLQPDGDVLMIGLGPGSGAVALLHHFPGLRVVAVEIDAEVVRLARAHFPLLARYEAQGRLTIIVGDALGFAQGNRHLRWASALIDAYQADATLQCPAALLAALRGTTANLWANVLDQQGGARAAAFIGTLAACGWAPTTTMPVHCVHERAEFYAGNLLIGTAAFPHERLLAFTPYPDLGHAHALLARRTYAAMVQHATAIAP